MKSDGTTEWDVFISYASEDRAEVAKPLARHLQDEGLRVWYDQLELKMGDSLRGKIDEGLARCRFGVVILSESFFCKHFTVRELQGLTQREVDGSTVILPVWHRITAERVRQLSPPLGDRVAAETSLGIAAVAKRILGAVSCRDLGAPETEDAYAPIVFASIGKRPSAQLEEFAPGKLSTALEDFAPGRLSSSLKDW